MSTNERNVSIPTISTNGTAPEDLLEALMTAYHAVKTLQVAMREVTPNGRDYYLQGDGATEKARLDHSERQCRIDEIRKDLETIIIGVQDQKDERDARREATRRAMA